MNRRSISLYLTRPLALLNIAMLIVAFGLSACSPYCNSSDCAPPLGTLPDATSLQVANGIAYYMANNTLYALDDHNGKLLWRFAAGEINQPVVSNGVVYLNIDNILNPNDSQFGEWVYALQGSDGKLLWRFRVVPYITQITPPPPQIIGGTVYAQSSNETYGSTLFALRASDGKLLWSQNPIGSNGESVTLMLAAYGIAYLNTYSSNTGYLIARNVSNGQQLWQYTFPHGSPGFANMTGNILYMTVISTQGMGGWGTTYAFQADTGQLLWQSPLGGSLTVTLNAIYLDDNEALFGNSSTDYFYALRPDNGKLLWQLQVHAGVEDSIPQIWAANTDAVYVTFGSSFGTTWYALGATNGKPLWRFPTQGNHVQQLAEPFSLINLKQWPIYANSVYLPAILLDPDKMKYDFELHAFQAVTGKSLWIFSPTPTVRGMTSFTIVQGVIYLNTATGQTQTPQYLWAIRAEDGKVLWHSIQSEKASNQVITPEGVYFSIVKGSANHFTYTLLALNTNTGKQSWAFQA
ncbi:MAG: PQQ-binding-like beta-propeller repeat protein [Ktedonobacteraceae bacterium]